MAQQGEIESAHARRVSGQGHGRRGPHSPARVGGAGRWIGIQAQKQRSDARLLRRQRQATAGGEVQLRRPPPDFEQQRTQSRRSQGFHGGAQQHRIILHHADQQMRRVYAQSRQPRPIRHALTRGGGRTQPQGRGLRSRKARKDQRKSRGRRLPAFAGKKFMHPPPRQSAAQHPVKGRMTKGEMGMARPDHAIQRGEAPLEGIKVSGRLDHHKCSLFVLFEPATFPVNRRFALMGR